jgi:hydroxylamine reductase
MRRKAWRYMRAGPEKWGRDRDVDVFTKAVFSTLTNVNFDDTRIQDLIDRAATMRDMAKALYEDSCRKAGQTPETFNGSAAFTPASDMAGLLEQGAAVSINSRMDRLGADIAGLQELLAYGIKGVAAYADHAHIMGHEDEGLYQGIHEALDFLNVETPEVNDLLSMCLKAGELNFKAMELLDAGNTGEYGHPVPTPVRINPLKGKAIVVSGHDLKDLEELLKQTEGKGINVYTHGEMLPAHGYPELKKYKHLAGNYGGAWQDQVKEFDAFPGAILMTTNCIQQPKEGYKGRIFTQGWWHGQALHVANRTSSGVVSACSPGFDADGDARRYWRASQER